MIPLHIGSDHPVSIVLVLLLAFGPFLIAGAIVFVVRRREEGAEQRALPASDPAPGRR